MRDLARLAAVFPGWGLTEIKALSPRERILWTDNAIMVRRELRGG